MTLCAACGLDFQQAYNAASNKSVPFEAGMVVVCVRCGTILVLVSPGESRIADNVEDDIPAKAYMIAYDVVYEETGQQDSQ
jgi:hypothetical protein